MTIKIEEPSNCSCAQWLHHAFSPHIAPPIIHSVRIFWRVFQKGARHTYNCWGSYSYQSLLLPIGSIGYHPPPYTGSGNALKYRNPCMSAFLTFTCQYWCLLSSCLGSRCLIRIFFVYVHLRSNPCVYHFPINCPFVVYFNHASELFSIQSPISSFFHCPLR